MVKNKICLLYLIIAVILLPGCAYLSNFEEAMFMKSLDANQHEMQAELEKEEKLYNDLKFDIDNSRLKKLTRRHTVFSRYGEPVLCKPAEGRTDIKKTCFYRKPKAGIFTEMILLNFDARDRLCSWQVENPGK